jgi:hypothetical protein
MKASELHHSLACPAGIFKGHTWWIIILAMTDKQWLGVCAALSESLNSARMPVRRGLATAYNVV